jgi:hypothetical protein
MSSRLDKLLVATSCVAGVVCFLLILNPRAEKPPNERVGQNPQSGPSPAPKVPVNITGYVVAIGSRGVVPELMRLDETPVMVVITRQWYARPARLIPVDDLRRYLAEDSHNHPHFFLCNFQSVPKELIEGRIITVSGFREIEFGFDMPGFCTTVRDAKIVSIR